MRITKLTLGPLNNNVYILTCEQSGTSVVVDASFDAEAIVAATTGTNVQAILLTHGDHDHIDALPDLRSKLRVPVGIHPADAEKLDSQADFFLTDGDRYEIGSSSLQMMHTPGHTPGSVCFHVDTTLIAGDTLFPGGPGATHNDAQRFAQIITSIREKLFVLPDETLVRPGHGDDTTIGTERPHLQEWIDRGW